MLTADDDATNQKVRALDLSQEAGRAGLFSCPFCQDPVSWVDGKSLRTDGQPRLKHFRHQSASSCITDEPETEAHAQGKLAVEEFIRRTGFGVPHLEHPFEGLVIDIYWERPGMKNVAIEVQATNYSTERYTEKIEAYREADLAVLYLLIPGNFRKELGRRVISTKAIERALFFDHTFGPEVGAAYLRRLSHKWVIEVPYLHPKYARGGGVNERRFFAKPWGSETIPAENRFRELTKESFPWPVFATRRRNERAPSMKCGHEKIRLIPGGETQIRYGRRCATCNENFGWLPDRVLIGLSLPRPDSSEAEGLYRTFWAHEVGIQTTIPRIKNNP